MFYDNQPEELIRSKTGLNDGTITELIKRCARKDADGGPVGWANLVKYGYLRSYTRRKAEQPPYASRNAAPTRRS